MAKKREYTGEGIVVQYELARCIHAAECVKGLPGVFDVGQRPWIQPANATADETANVIQRCPTGALQYERSDGGAQETTPDENRIVPQVDGPLYLEGDISLTLPDGSVVKETRLALCRCGDSQNKPFCDNAHQQEAFQANGAVSDNQADSAGLSPSGELSVNPYADGPILLTGNFEIRSADGTAVFRGEKCALCRCGGSANKPFCDGTHKAIGFQSG